MHDATDDWVKLVTGAPVLLRSAASFDCEVIDTADVGSHRVFFARVRTVGVTEDETALCNGEFVVPRPPRLYQERSSRSYGRPLTRSE